MAGLLCSCLGYSEELDGETAMVSRYDGDKNFLGQKHGYGTYMFPNGDLYEGCWKFNKMHGCGEYTHSSGEKINGFYQNGKFIGKQSNETTISSSEHVQPLPFPQTVRDEKQQAYIHQRKMERERKRRENEKQQAERQKKREEYRRKYPPKRRVEKYGAT